MPSSISNSEQPRGAGSAALKRATWALVLLSLGLYGCAEAAAFFGMQRVSRLHNRIMTEAGAAQRLQPARPGQPPVVLFVGNSLLLKGIDMPVLTAAVRDRYQARRFVIEATGYEDWLYGLKRLFRQGMRVDTVVLSLNSVDFTANTVRGEFTSHVLFDAEDIWPASRAVGADMTTTAGMYFAHFSKFYAFRMELRSVLLGKISLPTVAALQSLQWGEAVIPEDAKVVPEMNKRLRELQRLCAGYGASFTYLVPPTPLAGDTALVEAGRQTGIQVMHPIADTDLGLEYYEADKFHLNLKGTERFTNAVIETLRQGPLGSGTR